MSSTKREEMFTEKSNFQGFGDIEDCVQILCKNTVVPLTLEKQSFEVSNGNGVNTKGVGNDKTN